MRKKWAWPKKKRGGEEKPHLLTGRTNDKNLSEAFCGKYINPDLKRILDFDDYCPLDHVDDVCPECLKWWNRIRPGHFGRKKAAISST